MSYSTRCLANIVSTDLTFYAGDPDVLSEERYIKKIEDFLLSSRADQLTARVAIHAQLREAFLNSHVQKRLLPFIGADEIIEKYVRDPKARAKFFSEKKQALLRAVLTSEEQRRLKEVHGKLAAWERENPLLLCYQTSADPTPPKGLSTENAATAHLYHQHTNNGKVEATSDSGGSWVLKGALPKATFTNPEGSPAENDHGEILGEKVPADKYAEYVQLRQDATRLLSELEQSPLLVKLDQLIRIEKDIYGDFGIDRLVSLSCRKDKELGEPNEGGVDASTQNLPETDEIVLSCRVAQYSLPRIVETCYANYVSILARGDCETMVAKSSLDPKLVVDRLHRLRDCEVFRYWFLACITADCPEIGPNTIMGKSTVTLEDYKKHFLPRKVAYVPSINPSHRASFAGKVAERRGLPHIVALVPSTYSYRKNNDPNSIQTGTIDLMIYDATNEKVLLMVVNSASNRQSCAAFLNAQEERYRLAAVLRSAILGENQHHHFQCTGVVAEYFFDPKQGPEENYYCIMAPLRLRAKFPVTYKVPFTAFKPFTTCPPRYFALGSNWGIGVSSDRNPYPPSFAHIGLNEAAIHLVSAVPVDYVTKTILPKLQKCQNGLEQQREEGNGADAQRSQLGASTAQRSDKVTALLMGAEEEEDPLSPVTPQDALHGLRDWLLKKSSEWKRPAFVQDRARKVGSKALSADKEGHMRTPLEVFNGLLIENYDLEETRASCADPSHSTRLSQLSDIPTNRLSQTKTGQKATSALHS